MAIAEFGIELADELGQRDVLPIQPGSLGQRSLSGSRAGILGREQIAGGGHRPGAQSILGGEF